MTIRFRHIRNREWDYRVGRMTNLNRGGITLAFSENEDGTFQLGIAVCSGKDNFDPKVGRQIALRRLEEKAYTASEAQMECILTATDVFDLWISMEMEAIDAHFKVRHTLALV